MAEQRPECSELAKVLAKIALNFQERKPTLTLDGIVREVQTHMREELGLPESTHADISDAIVQFHTFEKKIQAKKEISAKMKLIRQATRAQSLRDQIDAIQLDGLDAPAKKGKDNATVVKVIRVLELHLKELKTRARIEKNISNMKEELADIEGLRSKLKEEFNNPKEPKLESEEIQRLRQEEKKMRAQITTLQNAMRPLTTLEKLLEFPRVHKGLRTMLDFSFLFGQGSKAALTHPTFVLNSIVPAMRASISKSFYEEKMLEVLSTPVQQMWPKEISGLQMVDPLSDDLAQRSELFLSRVIGKLPLVGPIHEGSNRGFSLPANMIRGQWFDHLVVTMNATTLEQVREIANFVNIATGRGGFNGPRADNVMVALNDLFYSTRNVLSHFQWMSGAPLWNASPAGRKAFAKEYARWMIGSLSVLAISKLMGADVEMDFRSSDFMKIRVGDGDSRIDFQGGLTTPIVAFARTLSGQTKPLSTGNVKDTRFFDTWKRFIRGKLAPTPSIIGDILENQGVREPFLARDFIGEEYDLRDISSLKHFLPLIFSDLEELDYKDAAIRSTILSAMAIFGFRISEFDPRR